MKRQCGKYFRSGHRVATLTIIGCCTLLLPNNSFSQNSSPYKLDWKKDLSLVAGGSIMLYAGSKLSDRHNTLERNEIIRFEKSEVFAFDRSATSNYSKKSGRKSDRLRNAAVALPLVFLPSKAFNKDFATIGAMALETFLITGGGTSIVKGAVGRTRPFIYNPNVPFEEKTGSGTQLSFFSGHTSLSSAFSFFAAKVVNDYSSNKIVKISVWSGAALLPATVGYLRYKSGKHFPTDIIAGYAFGALVGYFIPRLHQNKGNRPRKLAIAPSYMSGSLGVTLNLKIGANKF